MPDRSLLKIARKQSREDIQQERGKIGTHEI
jgi:hypothetical protein